MNTENGVGLAGKKDWRIPNVKKLQSIVDYGRCGPPNPSGNCADQAAIDPTFGPTAARSYWQSTTVAVGPADAWLVNFASAS